MKRVLMFLMILFGVIMQTTLLSFFSIREVTPNIIILLLIIFSFSTDFFTSIALALFAGLISDFLILNTIGINVLSYFVIAYACNCLKYEMDLDKKIVYVATVVVATLIYHGITLFVMFFLGYNVSHIYYIAEKILIQSAMNIALFFIVRKFIFFIFKILKVKFDEDLNEI